MSCNYKALHRTSYSMLPHHSNRSPALDLTDGKHNNSTTRDTHHQDMSTTLPGLCYCLASTHIVLENQLSTLPPIYQAVGTFNKIPPHMVSPLTLVTTGYIKRRAQTHHTSLHALGQQCPLILLLSCSCHHRIQDIYTT